MSEQDEVTGTVVRVSNYGVFIDIGAGVDAFLHRRKMKVSYIINCAMNNTIVDDNIYNTINNVSNNIT